MPGVSPEHHQIGPSSNPQRSGNPCGHMLLCGSSKLRMPSNLEVLSLAVVLVTGIENQFKLPSPHTTHSLWKVRKMEWGGFGGRLCRHRFWGQERPHGLEWLEVPSDPMGQSLALAPNMVKITSDSDVTGDTCWLGHHPEGLVSHSQPDLHPLHPQSSIRAQGERWQT